MLLGTFLTPTGLESSGAICTHRRTIVAAMILGCFYTTMNVSFSLCIDNNTVKMIPVHTDLRKLLNYLNAVLCSWRCVKKLYVNT